MFYFILVMYSIKDCVFVYIHLKLLACHTKADTGYVPFEYLMKLFCWLAISLGSFLRGEGPITIFYLFSPS